MLKCYQNCNFYDKIKQNNEYKLCIKIKKIEQHGRKNNKFITGLFLKFLLC